MNSKVKAAIELLEGMGFTVSRPIIVRYNDPYKVRMARGENYVDYSKRVARIMANLAEKAPDGMSGVIDGAVISFQVMDGHARYVVKEDPVDGSITYFHLPMDDGYTVEEAMLRGLTRENILDMARSEKVLWKTGE